jgi:isopentenyl diphosphate isomerase/L-lactate dehydrogenase-like FMN-dependent dehydrogenase
MLLDHGSGYLLSFMRMPLYWGLAVNGAEGVHGMLELLRQELDQVLGYCGQTDVQHLEPRLVTVPHGWGNGTMYP